MKTILVLPGSYWQIALIRKIKEMGHKVLVVNPYENSPCFPYADGHLQSDILDTKQVMTYAEENKIDAVMSDECDIIMTAIARIGEKFGLSSLDTASASLYTDKFLMREFCKQHGLKYPAYRLCKTADDAISLLKEIGRPLIIKPLDCNASKGVFKVESEDDIRKHFEVSMAFSSIEKSVLAERFIEGTEFTVDGVKTPSAHYTLAISEKKHFKHNLSIADELLFSHSNDRFNYEKLIETNNNFVMQSGLKYGFTHAEYKCEDGEYYLIEIAARGGGNMISSVITQYMSGYDTYRYLVECALGNVYDYDFSIQNDYKDRAAVLKFFKTPEGGGKVKDIHGLDYLDNEPDIVKYMLNFKIGDTIQDAVSDSARIGFYIACSENLQKLKEIMGQVEKGFSIELEKENVQRKAF